MLKCKALHSSKNVLSMKIFIKPHVRLERWWHSPSFTYLMSFLRQKLRIELPCWSIWRQGIRRIDFSLYSLVNAKGSPWKGPDSMWRLHMLIHPKISHLLKCPCEWMSSGRSLDSCESSTASPNSLRRFSSFSSSPSSNSGIVSFEPLPQLLIKFDQLCLWHAPS
jgi:hypothetical protein